jgi:hypothetical protein
MGDTTQNSGNYRVEVSGWGLNDVFFVEKTDLLWTEGEEKKISLRRALPEGAVIFIRLIAPETSYNSVPMAYQVEKVQPMDSTGLCEMRLLQLHPRSRTSTTSTDASQSLECSSKVYEAKESALHWETEEYLS